MIGCIAETLESGEEINLGNDAELEDAKWFTFDEAREALKKHEWGNNDAGTEPKLSLPPSIAIANRLVDAVVTGWGPSVGTEEKRAENAAENGPNL